MDNGMKSVCALRCTSSVMVTENGTERLSSTDADSLSETTTTTTSKLTCCYLPRYQKLSRTRMSTRHLIFTFFLATCLVTIASGAKFWRRHGPIPSDMTIGSSCRSSLQCMLFIPHSHCEWENRTCDCQPYHVQSNSSTCLPASLLGFGCSIDSQCTLKVPNSQCLNGLCQCKDNFMSYRRDKCLPPSKIGGYCLNDHQCKMGSKYSNCEYIIPRIYGKCKCPVGFVEAADGKCYPGLGKNCEEDKDCELATNNSFCHHPSFRTLNKKPTCACREGFEEKRNKCEALPKPTLAPLVFNLSEATEDISLVSLGKPCRSSIECQVRDAYSYCKDGLCECLSPTPKCNSLNTGCHNDTFQCRSGQCISWYFVCDKNKNCDDGSDEEECSINGGCPREAFECNDGTCLSRASVCNGRWECPDGSDEARCYKGIACDAKSFQCKSGQCLPQYAFCNAVTDCIDGSDELESECEQAKTCPVGTYQCKNNRCRSTAILCSGVDGCGDNSDEDRCDVCYCEKPTNRRSKMKF